MASHQLKSQGSTLPGNTEYQIGTRETLDNIYETYIEPYAHEFEKPDEIESLFNDTLVSLFYSECFTKTNLVQKTVQTIIFNAVVALENPKNATAPHKHQNELYIAYNPAATTLTFERTAPGMHTYLASIIKGFVVFHLPITCKNDKYLKKQFNVTINQVVDIKLICSAHRAGALLMTHLINTMKTKQKQLFLVEAASVNNCSKLIYFYESFGFQVVPENSVFPWKKINQDEEQFYMYINSTNTTPVAQNPNYQRSKIVQPCSQNPTAVRKAIATPAAPAARAASPKTGSPLFGRAASPKTGAARAASPKTVAPLFGRAVSPKTPAGRAASPKTGAPLFGRAASPKGLVNLKPALRSALRTTPPPPVVSPVTLRPSSQVTSTVAAPTYVKEDSKRVSLKNVKHIRSFIKRISRRNKIAFDEVTQLVIDSVVNQCKQKAKLASNYVEDKLKEAIAGIDKYTMYFTCNTRAERNEYDNSRESIIAHVQSVIKGVVIFSHLTPYVTNPELLHNQFKVTPKQTIIVNVLCSADDTAAAMLMAKFLKKIKGKKVRLVVLNAVTASCEPQKEHTRRSHLNTCGFVPATASLQKWFPVADTTNYMIYKIQDTL